ncbi:MAG: methyltransferase domain-containing protein [Pseudomonadota bacterium]|nr:methyltransferase domain-containing protein [Pseudomonadota bacterium]
MSNRKKDLCRICGSPIKTILDLGSTPLANSLVSSKDSCEENYELQLQHCNTCKNFQLSRCLDNMTLYSEYLYQTPNSVMLNEHYENILSFFIEEKYLRPESNCLEIGCNKGQLLKKISKIVRKNPVGIDPAENILKTNISKDINFEIDFFNQQSAKTLVKKYGKFNFVIARHCFAHNEKPQDMLEGLCISLLDDGYFIIENAYTLNTILNGEFDQIYHEHMYFYTISSLKNLLSQFNFEIIDSTIAPVHGGSIIAVCARKNKYQISHDHKIQEKIENIMLTSDRIDSFVNQVNKTITNLKEIVRAIKEEGKSIYCYGATAKGNTLLNSCNITSKQVDYCIDNTDIKIGKFLPGSKIEIISETKGLDNPPDFFLLTAWNYATEIIDKVRSTGNLKSKFIIPYPNPHIIS